MINIELPQGEQKVRSVRSMFDRIAKRYELVNRCMTFGLDTRWRKATLVKMQLEANSTVLDLACGTGDFCRLLTEQGHTALGIDSSLGMLQNARTTSQLIQADALKLPFADASVDAVTCGFALRNFVSLDGFFNEVARVVKPNGRIGFVDASSPTNPLLRVGHGLYFGKVVPVVGGLLSGDREAYAYLPKSLAYMPPIEQLLTLVHNAGFISVERQTFLGESAHLITATRSDR